MYIPHLHAFASLSGVFPLLIPLKYYILFFFFFFSLPLCCRAPFPSSTPQARGHPCSSLLLSLCPHLVRPRSSPAAFCVSCRVSCSCRHSSAIRRKTVWQCGQIHRVYVPGSVLVSSCLCAAVCSVACSVVRSVCLSVCVSCCLLSSGGSNSLYASMSRAFAMRCSVCKVMLLLSICIRTFCRVSPKRRDSSTTPTPTACMCSRI